MSSANPNYSFTVSENNQNYTINWTAAKLGVQFGMPLIWIVAILSFVLTIIMSNNDSSAITSFLYRWAGYFLLIYVGVFIVMNVLVRKGGHFSFNKDSFTLNGTVYHNNDIQGIYVRSPKGEKMEIAVFTLNKGYGVVNTVDNVATGMSMASTQARMAMMRAIREKSYAVCIQYGEREVFLAKHLTLMTAKAMFNKIDQLV